MFLYYVVKYSRGKNQVGILIFVFLRLKTSVLQQFMVATPLKVVVLFPTINTNIETHNCLARRFGVICFEVNGHPSRHVMRIIHPR